MEDKIRKSLEDTIEKEIQNLSDLQTGSKEKSAAVEDLAKLYNLKIEETKVEQANVEANEKRVMNDRDWLAKQEQLDSQIKDRWINVAVQVGLTLSSLIAYNCWFKRGLRFEETGTVTSPMTKNLISKMLPKK